MRYGPNNIVSAIRSLGSSVVGRLRRVFVNPTDADGGHPGQLGLTVSRADVEAAVRDAGPEEVASWLQRHGYVASNNLDPLWVLQAASEVNLQRLMRAKRAMAPGEVPAATKAARR